MKVVKVILSLVAMIGAVAGLVALLDHFLNKRSSVERRYDMYGNEIEQHDDHLSVVE